MFYPGQSIHLNRAFCSMCTPIPPLGPQHLVPEPVPSLETHLKSDQEKGRPDGCRYVGRKEKNTNEIQWQVKKSTWKNTEIRQVKGKAAKTRIGPRHLAAAGYQSPPNILGTYSVRKCRDIGHLRALSPRVNGWMYVCMHVCTCMHVCRPMYVCMYVCMYRI